MLLEQLEQHPCIALIWEGQLLVLILQSKLSHQAFSLDHSFDLLAWKH